MLSSALIEFDVPVLGHLKFVTSLFFDIGVYLVVIGLVLDVLRSLGARIETRRAASPRTAAAGAAMTVYLVPLDR